MIKHRPLATVVDEEKNRRADLVRVSARLFREKGYDATTVRDIANAVGMRSGSPFYHFKSKQEILAAVMEEGLVAGLEEVERIVASDMSALDKFGKLLRAHLETVLGEGHDFIPVLLYDWHALSPELQGKIIDLKDRYDQLWQKSLSELKQAGLIKSDSKIVRLLLLGAINYSVQWYKPGKGLNLDQLAEQILEFFLTGVAPSE
ncbi:TetR/AcrR family transcriptional regulator [Undibacterium sp. Jales W-56]|uniref:TetR/AcrR family transcriptional regulator n=1 Tax=Undibacterium sp. Jales W-56 TaxID=2897325 RepID=UPI0021D29330|nr:TetR/AcrR family transcriptional regulator [Undibacterium sp. Jales W-56]MCU6433539.1 TetR/AcrR family transcriptional regulator [Undibacterium sp. Jales W-56]